MSKLAVIVPFCNEHPQLQFTIRAIHEELEDVPHIIYIVDNYCDGSAELKEHPRDGSHDKYTDRKGFHEKCLITTMAEKTSWYRRLVYDKQVSHWQAKDYAIQNSNEDLLLFLDAHIIPGRGSISKATLYYQEHLEELKGTLGMPLTYHIIEDSELEYKFVPQLDKSFLNYSFTTHNKSKPYVKEVPCHSMCGCFLTREMYSAMGGWGPTFGPYSGGEQLMNFTLPILGYKHWMWQGKPIHHYGAERGYCANQAQLINNRAIAAHRYGGERWLHNYLVSSGLPNFLQVKYEQEILETYADVRKAVADKQVMEIEQWISMNT